MFMPSNNRLHPNWAVAFSALQM